MKRMIGLGFVFFGILAGRGVDPLSTLCTGTAPTVSVPAAWDDGEVVSGNTPLIVDAHSLTGDMVTVAVDGLTAMFAGGGGTFRWQPWTSGEHVLTHTVWTNVWTLRVSGAQSAAGLSAGAFRDCANLVSVTVPDGVTSIGRGAFSGCGGLVGIAVDPGNPCYSSRNGLLLSRDGTELVEGVNGDVVVPDGVADIGDSAFRGPEIPNP